MTERDPEERATYVVLILAGFMPLVAALLAGGRVGAGVTISFLMLALGATGLVSSTWRSTVAARSNALACGRDQTFPPRAKLRGSGDRRRTRDGGGLVGARPRHDR